jgi:putative phosphoesterase
VRVAVVSDIHGNLTALEAVIERLGKDRPDLVVQAGDLVVTGPRPAEVVARIRSLGWAGVIGNTDEMLWNESVRSEQFQRAPKLIDWLTVLFDTLAPWAKARLGDEQLRWLRALPPELRINGLVVMHASRGNLWRAPMPDASDAELSATYGQLGADMVVYGHVHRPFIRNLGSLTILNAGSVGLPYDGDWRPSYVFIDEGAPVIRRVEYDRDAEQRAIIDAGFPLADWLTAVQRDGRFSRPRRPDGGPVAPG